ncbi:hypothetical protein BDF22DRAFT_681742 [Syncephalis plumigaleata]|nr:hypothetical protein BDF22DRAFT_681742 [Syncephalis plumigaleata]
MYPSKYGSSRQYDKRDRIGYSRRRINRRFNERNVHSNNRSYSDEETKSSTNLYEPAVQIMNTTIIIDSSDEENATATDISMEYDFNTAYKSSKARGKMPYYGDNKPNVINLVGASSSISPTYSIIDLDTSPHNQTQRIKSVVRKSAHTIIHDITTSTPRKSSSPFSPSSFSSSSIRSPQHSATRNIFNRALADVFKSRNAEEHVINLVNDSPASSVLLDRLRASHSRAQPPGQRLPREIVTLIIAFMSPNKSECLALRGVSCIFYDALTMWQADEVRRLFEERYGPETPPSDLTWATDGQVLEQHISCNRTLEKPYVDPKDRIGVSTFHRWITLAAPRPKLSACLRCGRLDDTLIIRDGANLGRFCVQCWDTADYWLRWRICHWVRLLDDLVEFRQSWFVALTDLEWLNNVPCYPAYDDNGKIRYAVPFNHFCRLVEQWTDCPPYTLELQPNGRWESVTMSLAQLDRLSAMEGAHNNSEALPLPPGFMPHLTEDTEGTSAAEPIILT